MLFTRCPDCETTFRITAEALAKAGGQVRCGRCASVFDAYEGLREHAHADRPDEPLVGAGDAATVAETREAEANEAAAVDEGDADEGDADEVESDEVEADEVDAQDEVAAAPEEDAPDQIEAAALEHAAHVASPAPRDSAAPITRPADPAASFDGLTVAGVIEQIESSSAEEDALGTRDTAVAGAREAEPISAEQVYTVLEESPDDVPPAAWDGGLAEPRKEATRWWIVGCACAAALLALQATHHYRDALAGTTLVGPLLQDAYAFLGTEVEPSWDVTQYQIMDWVATAEPNAEGEGSLEITARIYNKGPKAQPYPHVHLQLKDRWEGSVASRVFEPSEYLDSQSRAAAFMAPGDTARARLEVVDPGPDTYGFELDVCVPQRGGALRCRNDEVFR